MSKNIKVKTLTEKLNKLDTDLTELRNKIEQLQKEEKAKMVERDELESKDFELTQEAEEIANAFLNKSNEDAQDLLERVIKNLKSGGAPSKITNSVKRLLTIIAESCNEPETDFASQVTKPIEYTEVNKQSLAPIFEEKVEKEITFFEIPSIESDSEQINSTSVEIESEATIDFDSGKIQSNSIEKEEIQEEIIQSEETEEEIKVIICKDNNLNEQHENKVVEIKFPVRKSEIKVGDLVGTTIKGAVYKVIDINPEGTYTTTCVAHSQPLVVNMDFSFTAEQLKLLPYNNYQDKLFEFRGQYIKILDELKDSGLSLGMQVQTVDINGKAINGGTFVLSPVELEEIEEVI